MKYNVTRQELNECIAEAVSKVIKEDLSWDEIDAIVNNAEKDERAKRAAEKDVDKETTKADAEDAKLANLEKSEMDSSDDESPISDVDPKNLSFEDLSKPKNISQARAFKTELIKRERIKQEFEEDGIQPEWGYEIDDNGNVQPTHTDLGSKDSVAWDGRGGNIGGLNFGCGYTSAD